MVIKYRLLSPALICVLLSSAGLSADNKTNSLSQPHAIWLQEQGKFSKAQIALNTALQQKAFRYKQRTFENQSNQQLPKSRGRAFLQSLVLPGWGQHYAGSKTMMKVFIVSEVLTWGSYLGFKTWGNWLEDDFHTFAATHAGVDVASKSNAYFVDIGRFNDIFEYNQAQLRDRDVVDLYPETQEFFWRWDNDSNRREFDDMRKRSALARNRSEFALAAIVVNHLASAIHSMLSVYKFNKKHREQELGFRLDVVPTETNQKVMIVLTKQF